MRFEGKDAQCSTVEESSGLCLLLSVACSLDLDIMKRMSPLIWDEEVKR